MSYLRPKNIPCRDNGQPLYRFPKKGAIEAPMNYDLLAAWSHVTKPGFKYGSDIDAVIWQDNPVWHGGLEFVELYSSGGSSDPYKSICVLRHTTLGHFYPLPYEYFVSVMKTRNFLNGVVSGKWQFERRGPYCTLVPVD